MEVVGIDTGSHSSKLVEPENGGTYCPITLTGVVKVKGSASAEGLTPGQLADLDHIAAIPRRA